MAESFVEIKDWLKFLEEKYKKNIRSVKDAKSEFKPETGPIKYIIYPDVTNEQTFFVFSYGTGLDNAYKFNLYKLIFKEYMENTGQIKFYYFDSISNKFELMSETATINSITTIVLNGLLPFAYSDEITQAGGRRSRRRSRKAKKNKAHTPQ